MGAEGVGHPAKTRGHGVLDTPLEPVARRRRDPVAGYDVGTRRANQSGGRDFPCRVLFSVFPKIFSFSADPNQFTCSHRLVPQRGARAIVTNAGRDAVDIDGADDDRRWRWTAKSCGPGAPTLVSSLREDAQTTVANKHGHRGEHEGNR